MVTCGSLESASSSSRGWEVQKAGLGSSHLCGYHLSTSSSRPSGSQQPTPSRSLREPAYVREAAQACSPAALHRRRFVGVSKRKTMLKTLGVVGFVCPLEGQTPLSAMRRRATAELVLLLAGEGGGGREGSAFEGSAGVSGENASNGCGAGFPGGLPASAPEEEI